MQTRALRLEHGQVLLVRPLRNGDVETVIAVFERLGERSRRTRFNGAKPRLSSAELGQLAAVDATRHVLVGYLKGDDRPVAIARLVRDGSSAEIAFEVVDEHPAARHRLGAHRGAARRRACGGDHGGHGARLERQPGRDVAAAPAAERLEVRFEGPELSVRAALA